MPLFNLFKNYLQWAFSTNASITSHLNIQKFWISLTTSTEHFGYILKLISRQTHKTFIHFSMKRKNKPLKRVYSPLHRLKWPRSEERRVGKECRSGE